MEDAAIGVGCESLADCIKELIRYIWKYGELVESVEKELQHLDSVISDVLKEVSTADEQRREIKENVKLWIINARDERDAANNFLKTTQKNTMGCRGRECNCWKRYWDAKKAEDHVKEIGKLAKRGETHGKVYSSGWKPDPMAGFWAANYVELPSMDETIEQLKGFLHAKLVMGIYGVKGVGKSTVAKKFAADMESAGEVKVVVADIKELMEDKKNIQRQIAERVGFEITTESVPERAGSLYKTLSKMKVLIVFDNLDRKISLSDIGIPEPAPGNGCRILVVSTCSEVCTAMYSQMNLQIKPLTREESETFADALAIRYHYKQSDYSLDSISSDKAGLPTEIERVVRSRITTPIELGREIREVGFKHLDQEPRAEFWAKGYVALTSMDETIEKLKKFLQVGGSDDASGTHKELVIGIYGVEGVGKTRVAKKFAADMESTGEVKVVVADIKELKEDVKNIQSQIAERVGFEFTTESVTERAKSLHKTLSMMKVLIIFDNLDRKIDLSAIGIPEPAPGNDCRILVVSTSSEVCTAYSQMNLQIKPLTREESETFADALANRYHYKRSDYSLDSISSHKVGLPAEIERVVRNRITLPTIQGREIREVDFKHLDPEPRAEFWAEGYVALPSMDETIEKLKKFLQVGGSDDVGGTHKELVMGIYGVEGVGKTRVAKKFAADMESAREVKVVIADIKEDKKNIQSQIAERVGFEFTTESVTERAESLNKTLSTMKVLIIFDNLNRKIDLSAIGIPEPAPGNDCRILVVSTSSEVCTAYSQMNLQIKPLTREESETFADALAIRYHYNRSDYSLDSISSDKAGLPAEIERVVRNRITLPTIQSSSSSVISLGAWGGSGGKRWSCIATSGITEITIMGEGNIQFISWTDASGDFSGTFGADGLNTDAWGVKRKVRINWPSEYLTSIRGTYGDYGGLQVVISLSFITNHRTYGPFGSSNSGQAFSTPISDSVVIGFYGRCGLFLDAIGIHVRPMTPRGSVTMGPWGGSGGGSFTFQSSSSSVISLGAWGGSGGKRWSCIATSGITEITIMGEGNIQFISWTDASGDFSGTFGAYDLNTNAWGVKRKVRINWPSEYLTSIRGTYGDYGGLQVVISLSFITNHRTYGPFGSSNSGQAFSIPISDSVVVGFYGRCGLFLDAIGIHVRPMTPRGSITMGPWGGSGGGSFTFQVHTGYIKRITVCHGDGVITRISFKDSNGRDYGPFGKDPGVPTVIEIGDSQRLTSISGTFENFVGMTLVTSLSFRINNIINGPYGTQTGTSFSIPMQGSEVIGFFGRSGRYLDSIGLYVK